MAKTLSASPLITIKEDYIDMDLSPKMSSPSEDLYGGDFEFKMSLNNDIERESNTFPADELFYKGNLLPLQLPPRLQLFQKLVHNHKPLSNFSKDTSLECPDEKSVIKSMPRKHWPKRLKFFKQTHLTSKFKASKGYLKSLFTKTNNSIQEENDQFGALKSTIAIDREKFLEEGTGTTHRKSFSGVIRRRLTGKSSQVSGSSMCSSSDLNRWFEEESSIQGAIAYCKKTQENLVPSRKSVSDVIFPSFALPRVSVGCENQEREEISRG